MSNLGQTGGSIAAGIKGAENLARAQQHAHTAASALISVLQRLLPIASRLVGFVRVLAVLSACFAVLIVGSYLIVDVPRTVFPYLIGLVLLAVFLAPALILWMFHNALREVLALPDWLRSSPDIAREHGAELADLVRTAASGGPPGQPRRPLRDVRRAGKLLLETHRDLPEYGAVLKLINPFFLFLVLISTFATIFQAFMVPVVFCFAVVLRMLS